MPSPLTRPYYLARRLAVTGAGRLCETADRLARRACSLPSPTAKRLASNGVQAVAQLAGWLASAPRVDIRLLHVDSIDAYLVGSDAFLPELGSLLGADDSGADVAIVARAPIWPLGRTLRPLVEDGALVVRSLPFVHAPVTGPGLWSFTLPIVVSQDVDITRPLDEITRHRSLKNNLTAARRMELSTRVTRSVEDFRTFHSRLYRPHIERRHGPRALTTTMARQWTDWMARNGELILLEKHGSPVAGVIAMFEGDTAFLGEEGVAPELSGAGPSRGVQAELKRAVIARAQQRGCIHISLGSSMARCTDGVFQAKRVWGARVGPARRSAHPWWTLASQTMPVSLAGHLNAQRLVAYSRQRFWLLHVEFEPGQPAAPSPEQALHEGLAGVVRAGPGYLMHDEASSASRLQYGRVPG